MPRYDWLKGCHRTGHCQHVCQCFEAGSGRSTIKKTRVRVHEAQHYIGFKSGAEAIEAGNTYAFTGRIVDWQGRTVDWNEPVSLDFSLLQTGHNWTYNEQKEHTARRYQKVIDFNSIR